MNIRIDEKMKETYPMIRLGCIEYDVKVELENGSLWNYIHEECIPKLMEQFETIGLTNIEGIQSSRNAYKAFGRNPSRYRVSSESLLRRIRQGHELYHVNTVVDTNNLISIQTACSVGSYDAKHIQGDVVLSVGKAGEGYKGIGKDYIDMENMILLKDDLGAFGSPTSDSHRAMIEMDTKHVITLIYCFSDQLDLNSELNRASEYLKKYVKAENIETCIIK